MSEIRDQCPFRSRIEAANLLRQLRDGEITNRQFEDAFYPLCHRTKDRALKAIATAVWTFYSDLREEKLPQVDGEAKALFDRSILFLRSDLEYEWERDNFISIAGLNPLIHTAFKVVSSLVGQRKQPTLLRPGPETLADWDLWPFADQQDIDNLKAQIRDSASDQSDRNDC